MKERIKNFIKAIGYLVLYLGVLGIVSSILVPISVYFSKYNNSDYPITMKILQGIMNDYSIISSLLADILIIIIIIFRVRKTNIISETVLKKVPYKLYLIPSLIVFLYSAAWNIWFEKWLVDQSGSIGERLAFQNEMIEQSMAFISEWIPYFGPTLIMLGIMIIAPLTEEIVFRGLIMSRLRRSFSFRKSVMISAIFFGLIHYMAGGVGLMVFALVGGILFGYTYEKSGSLFPAIVVHIIGNVTGALVAYLQI